MGYYDVRVGSTLCPADVFVALDDAGNIWTLGYVYYNNTVKLYTLDDVEKTTLPELSYPGFDQNDSSMSSLVYAEEESGDVLYLSYFNGETNDIYRLAYSTDDGRHPLLGCQSVGRRGQRGVACHSVLRRSRHLRRGR